MGKLKYVLLVLGLLLCIYPIVRQRITRVDEEKIALEYRENQTDKDVVGIISIPKLEVLLPIYEGTTEEVLQKGVGHIEVSSPLGGGFGTHCLLAGHRGLPNAELFRRVGQLQVGDKFHIEAKGQRYTYQVCKIRVIQPDETEGLGICENEDLVSLITCTPYGINTHRLIVTGERMEEKK